MADTNKHSRYEIRTKGDGEFDFLVEAGDCDDCGWNSEYDHLNLRRCKEHAKCCDGYVVRITEQVVA